MEKKPESRPCSLVWHNLAIQIAQIPESERTKEQKDYLKAMGY